MKATHASIATKVTYINPRSGAVYQWIFVLHVISVFQILFHGACCQIEETEMYVFYVLMALVLLIFKP